MKLFATLLAVLVSASSAFAAPQVLSIPAQGGAIRITPIFHASMQIEYRGEVIHVDPFSTGDYSGTKKANLILITHTHPDHLDPKAIAAAVNPRWRTIVAPPAVSIEQATSRVEKSRWEIGLLSLKNGQSERFGRTRQKFIHVEAVPMYNLVRGPKPGQKFHPKGQFNGYILTLGGKRIYIAGDTEFVPEMKKLKNIDVAFLPMNLPYTMTPQEAAQAARAFQPKIAVPYHYRYPFDKPNTNPQQFQAALRGTKIGVKLFDWYRK